MMSNLARPTHHRVWFVGEDTQVGPHVVTSTFTDIVIEHELTTLHQTTHVFS